MEMHQSVLPQISNALSGDFVVVILRGLPGSGKSTLAQELQTHALQVPKTIRTCSADDFFTHEGKYAFDPRRLGEAHANCLAEVLKAFKQRISTIVVDNTHISRWEYANTQRIATMLGYDVVIIEVMPEAIEALQPETEEVSVPGGATAAVHCSEEVKLCAARNVHHVGQNAIAAMAARWEPDPDAILIRVPALALPTCHEGTREGEAGGALRPTKRLRRNSAPGLPAASLCEVYDEISSSQDFAGAAPGAREATCAVLRHLSTMPSTEVEAVHRELVAGFIGVFVRREGRRTMAVGITSRAMLTQELSEAALASSPSSLGADGRSVVLGVHGTDGSVAIFSLKDTLPVRLDTRRIGVAPDL